MPNRVNTYYVADDVTFRGTFKIDGTAQTPVAGSATALVMEKGTNTPKVSSTAATISGTQLQYKYTNLVEGRFAIYFRAAFDSSADERSGVIEFVVRPREAH
jgi:hypothetical protein